MPEDTLAAATAWIEGHQELVQTLGTASLVVLWWRPGW